MGQVKSCRAKNRQTAVRLPGIRRLRIVATISSSVKSGCWATRASSAFACFSNGDLLPPVGFALALPVSRHRCNHFTAELGHRLKLSAASRRDAPASTASITRSRKSSEYGFGIAWTPKGRISAVRLVPRHALGNPFDSTQPENALAPVTELSLRRIATAGTVVSCRESGDHEHSCRWKSWQYLRPESLA